jgi:flavorubredoxin
METAIIYKTIYGSTAKYAKWLGESVKADIYDMTLAKTNILKIMTQ